MSDDTELTGRQREVLNEYPGTRQAIADALGVTPSAVEDHHAALVDKGFTFECDRSAGYRWDVTGTPEWYDGDGGEGDPFEYVGDQKEDHDLPDLSDVALGEDPDEGDLSDRERVIVSELQQGPTPTTLRTNSGRAGPWSIRTFGS